MSVKNVSKTITTASVLTLLIVSFQNCSKSAFSPADSQALAKLNGANDTEIQIPSNDGDHNSNTVQIDPKDPVDEVEAVDQEIDDNNPQDPYSGACEVFRSLGYPSEKVFAASNVYIDGRRSDQLQTSIIPRLGKLSTLEIANHVTISAFAGSLLIKEANIVDSVRIATNSLKINANEVREIRMAGHVCLHARKVGQITGAAHVKIISEEVEKLSFSGHAHIYGAKVAYAEGAGSICLYNGAKVLSTHGSIRVKDCSKN